MILEKLFTAKDSFQYPLEGYAKERKVVVGCALRTRGLTRIT